MNVGIELMTQNLGFTFENLILIVAFIGGIIFYAKDIKLGFIMHFVMFGVIYAWFRYAGYVTQHALILMFIFLVMMALSLFWVVKASKSPEGYV